MIAKLWEFALRRKSSVIHHIYASFFCVGPTYDWCLHDIRGMMFIADALQP